MVNNCLLYVKLSLAAMNHYWPSLTKQIKPSSNQTIHCPWWSVRKTLGWLSISVLCMVICSRKLKVIMCQSYAICKEHPKHACDARPNLKHVFFYKGRWLNVATPCQSNMNWAYIQERNHLWERFHFSGFEIYPMYRSHVPKTFLL